MSRRARIVLLAPFLAWAGCANPSGPVFGEWRGDQPGPGDAIPNSVDLVLEGGPGARGGHYSIVTLAYGGTVDLGARERRWGGAWEMEDRAFGARTLPVVRLREPLPGDIAAYALLPDRTLHALDPDGGLDDSPRAGLYTLSPVPPGRAGP